MEEAVFFDTMRQGLWISVQISAPLLAVALVMGVAIGLLQALTSVQEMTLTFVPKIIVAALILLLLGNWMMGEMVGFTRQLFHDLPALLQK